MSIVASVEFDVEADRVREFLAVLRAVLPDTRAYDGCDSAEIFTEPDRPGFVFGFERWVSREQFDAYQAWRAEGDMPARVGSFVTSRPRWRFFEPRPDV